MSRIADAIGALTHPAHPETTLIAFTLATCIEYPAASTRALDRDHQTQLRRLERAARIALKKPPASLYSVLPGPDWHVLLAPHASPERLYLARANHQRHYVFANSTQAPIAPPGTSIARWQHASTAEHRFTHVAGSEQESLLMHYSTADRFVHITGQTARDGQARVYHALPVPGAEMPL